MDKTGVTLQKVENLKDRETRLNDNIYRRLISGQGLENLIKPYSYFYIDILSRDLTLQTLQTFLTCDQRKQWCRPFDVWSRTRHTLPPVY